MGTEIQVGRPIDPSCPLWRSRLMASDAGPQYVPPVDSAGALAQSAVACGFASHQDFQRAWERALRRVAVPMAYSTGFSPASQISIAGAALFRGGQQAGPRGSGSADREPAGTVPELSTGRCPRGWTWWGSSGPTVHWSRRRRPAGWRIQWPMPVGEAVPRPLWRQSHVEVRPSARRKRADAVSMCVHCVPTW